MIRSKLVYKLKLKQDDNIDCFKALLVAKGYNQVEGKYFTHSFNPVAKAITVRLILAMAASKSWPIHQLDNSNAFSMVT